MPNVCKLTKILRPFQNSRRYRSVTATEQTVEDYPVSLDFHDVEMAYSRVETKRILRALSVLKLCSNDYFVQNSLKLLHHGERFLSRPLLEAILRPTLYSHFVAGNTDEELLVSIKQLHENGIRLMVLPSLEEDVGGSAGSSSKYDSNTETTLKLGEIAASNGGSMPCLQTKITALMPAQSLVNIARLASDYKSQLKMAELFSEQISGGKRVHHIPGVSSKDLQHLIEGLDRLKLIGQMTSNKGLRLLVDGEYTYINGAISLVAMAMAFSFNGTRPVVWNTYQCYLKEAHLKIKQEMALADEVGVAFGAKIVRGAYLQRERDMAKRDGVDDPTNPTYEATSQMYNSVVKSVLHRVAAQPHRTNMIVATHNEDSVKEAAKQMKYVGISPQDDTVVFGQIYGMADNISNTLAHHGYIVYKSVPYGSLFDVLPYLSRRAIENKSVMEGTRPERQLLLKSLRQRLFGHRQMSDKARLIL